MWIPFGDPLNKDWVKISVVGPIPLGSSHVIDKGVYPSWGDDATLKPEYD